MAWTDKDTLVLLDLFLLVKQVEAQYKRINIVREWNRNPANREKRRGYEQKYRRSNRNKVASYPSRLKRKKNGNKA